jgi:hypothetical protein
MAMRVAPALARTMCRVAARLNRDRAKGATLVDLSYPRPVSAAAHIRPRQALRRLGADNRTHEIAAAFAADQQHFSLPGPWARERVPVGPRALRSTLVPVRRDRGHLRPRPSCASVPQWRLKGQPRRPRRVGSQAQGVAAGFVCRPSFAFKSASFASISSFCFSCRESRSSLRACFFAAR